MGKHKVCQKTVGIHPGPVHTVVTCLVQKSDGLWGRRCCYLGQMPMTPHQQERDFHSKAKGFSFISKHSPWPFLCHTWDEGWVWSTGGKWLSLCGTLTRPLERKGERGDTRRSEEELQSRSGWNRGMSPGTDQPTSQLWTAEAPGPGSNPSSKSLEVDQALVPGGSCVREGIPR